MHELLYTRRKKYGSLLVSAAFHALLLLLLYALRTVKIILLEHDALPQRQTPASVSMATPSTKTASLPVPDNKQAGEPERKAPAPEEYIKSSDSSFAPAKAARAYQEPARVENIEPETAQRELSVPEETSSNLPQKNNQSVEIERKIIPNGIRDLNQPTEKKLSYAYAKVKKKKRRKITGTQLLQAFRAAYRSDTADQWGHGRHEPQNQYSEEPVSSSDANRAYVEHNLKQWKFAHYNTKVHRSIAQACENSSPTFYFDESVHATVTFHIVINKDGSIKEFSLEPSTGNRELDERIKQVLTTAKFAPIPNHLACSHYKFSHTVPVNIEKGYGKFVYTYPKNLDI